MLTVAVVAEVARACGVSPSFAIERLLGAIGDGSIADVQCSAELSECGQWNVTVPIEVVEDGALGVARTTHELIDGDALLRALAP